MSLQTQPAPAATLARPAQRERLAVVLMTKNEEARLAACLDRVAGWADEIVIIDDLSTDRTVEIARRYTDRIVQVASHDDHFAQWNRGIEQATSQWILHIDADEWVTPTLRAAIDQRLIDPAGHAGFDLMRKNVFLGHPMQAGGWYHRHRILFRKERTRCEGKGIHVQLQIDGPVGFIDADIEHYPFTSLDQFIDRQNHYTTVDAGVMAEARPVVPKRRVLFQTVVRPVKLYWKMYHKLQGRRDGWVGLVFSVLFAFMHLLLWAKYWEQIYGRAPGGDGRSAS
jgi:glycosyltransferase involved in cell wall biosynthesis